MIKYIKLASLLLIVLSSGCDRKIQNKFHLNETTDTIENIEVKPPIRESLLKAIDWVMEDSKDDVIPLSSERYYYYIGFYEENNANMIYIDVVHTPPINPYDGEIIKLGSIEYKGFYLLFNMANNKFEDFISSSELNTNREDLDQLNPKELFIYDGYEYLYEMVTLDSLMFKKKRHY